MSTESDHPDARSAFPTTHWSVVLHAQSGDAVAARAALETLCRCYWYPLYAFIRRQGQAHHAAEDLTQGFLAELLGSDGVARVRPERGRFRTFLLGALRNFLTDEWRRAHAQKRAGGREALPLEIAGAAQRFATEPPDTGLTPEEAFDRAWALDVIDHALAELRDEYAASGRGPLFAALGPCVWGEGATQPQAARAAQLGMSEHAFTMAVSRLRSRLKQRLREHIAATVAHDAEVAGELSYLLAAVRAKR